MLINIICRLCAGTESLINISYKNRGNELRPYEIANCLLGTQIDPGDCLPSYFCKICCDTLKSFYDFKIKCMKVIEQLKKEESQQSFNLLSQKIKKEIDDKSNEKCAVEEFNSNEYSNDELPLNKKKIGRENLEEKTKNKEFLKIENDSISSGYFNNKIDKKEITKDHKNEKKRCHYSVTDFQCHICGSTLKSKSGLKNHISSHSGLKKYSCSICFKKFTRLDQQKIHYRSHMGIKPCMCDLCGKGFTKKQDLVRHLTIHSEERRHKCPLCDKHFKRTSGVRVHMTVHTGEKKYSCKICDKSYKAQNGLLKHTRLHHPS